MHLDNKVVVVTGAGNGLGRQLTLRLLAKGALVVAVDINADALAETKNLTGALSKNISLHSADISKRDAVAQLAADVIEHYGYVDAIINNAGVIHPFKPVSELDYGVLERMIDINLYGTINLIKIFLPVLLQRPEAHIANVSSMGGLFAFPNQSFYGASKAAVKIISEGLYAELKGTNVGITVAFPGAINTEITKNCGAHSEKFDKLSKYFSGTSPQTAARKIIGAIERKKFRLIIGVDAKFLSFLYWLSPNFAIVFIRKVMSFVI
jgi:short-subunit dehydrogenase